MDKKMLEYASVGSRSPGPAEYSVKPTIGKFATDPTIEKNPAYSILGKRNQKIESIGPGPGYDVSTLNHYGKHRVLGGLLSKRLDDKAPAQTPGPADYCVQSHQDHGAIKMVRPSGLQLKPRSMVPGPNAYILPDALNKQAAPLGKRFPPLKAFVTPGPGAYDLPHGDRYLAGRYGGGRTMAGRPKRSRVPEMPGPAAYDGSKPKCCTIQPSMDKCRTTFGAKRPDIVPPFAVPADNEYDSDCCK